MRKLDERDLEILKKLAPEMRASEMHYRSILPPVSMHYAADEDDFQDRLERLSEGDLKYLAGRILDGSECLLCISPESAKLFIKTLEEKTSGEEAGRIKELYESATGYSV